jgi:uncharacterized protein YbgA (DUF1722 family)
MLKWEPEKIRLGVSACLLGDEVRYDGGHKRDAFLVDTLGPFVEWVPVCPEVEVGLGVPPPRALSWKERVRAAARAGTGRLPRGPQVRAPAHSPRAYAGLGRLVAAAGPRLAPATLATYGTAFMAALAVRATRGRHVNVLEHLAGFFKRQLTGDERAELAEVIAEYRRGLVPLVVPITLLKHHVRRLNVAYLAEQVYLAPHPRQLMLRNHA